MSNSVQSTGSSGIDRSTVPRAVVHKKILDAAEARPDVSMEELAEGVSGASLRLVEQVLEEYGDPGAAGRTADDAEDTPANEPTTSDSSGASTLEDDVESTRVTGTDSTETNRRGGGDETDAHGPPAEPTASSATEPESSSTRSAKPSSTGSERDASDDVEPTGGAREDAEGSGSKPDVPQLTHKQLQTVRAIRDDGDATQGELAERLGVSRAAICQRVNAIEGFEWSNRERFVETLFEEGSLQTNGYVRTDRQFRELTERVDELVDRLERIEGRLDERPARSAFGIDDPELAHKVVHACLHSERISEAEELAIVRCLFPRAGIRE